VAVLWFSPGTPDKTTKTDRHDITEILLKVVLNTIAPFDYISRLFLTYWFSLPVWYIFIIQGEVFSYVPFSFYMIRPEHTVVGILQRKENGSFLPNCIRISASNTLFFKIKIVFRSFDNEEGMLLASFMNKW